jgi:hypothetical protein
MGSHFLPCKVTDCYGKPLFAIAIQLSVCKSLIDIESQCFYEKSLVAMKSHWFAIECHCLPCKVNGCHGKLLVVIGSHWMLKGFFFQIFMIEMKSQWFICQSMIAMTVSVCYWKSLVVMNVYGCY